MSRPLSVLLVAVGSRSTNRVASIVINWESSTGVQFDLLALTISHSLSLPPKFHTSSALLDHLSPGFWTSFTPFPSAPA